VSIRISIPCLRGGEAYIEIPTIMVDGIEYVERSHFDATVFAATNNQRMCSELQNDRDHWKAEANKLFYGKRKRHHV
jgi:hypothetical protein